MQTSFIADNIAHHGDTWHNHVCSDADKLDLRQNCQQSNLPDKPCMSMCRQATSQTQLEYISTHLTQPIPHHGSSHSISQVCVFENDQWRLSPQLHGNLQVTTWSSPQIIVISHFMKCKFTNVPHLACCQVLESQISSYYMQWSDPHRFSHHLPCSAVIIEKIGRDNKKIGFSCANVVIVSQTRRELLSSVCSIINHVSSSCLCSLHNLPPSLWQKQTFRTQTQKITTRMFENAPCITSFPVSSKSTIFAYTQMATTFLIVDDAARMTFIPVSTEPVSDTLATSAANTSET